MINETWQQLWGSDPCIEERHLREPNRNVEELGEVREHRAVESVRCGAEEEGIVAKQDG